MKHKTAPARCVVAMLAASLAAAASGCGGGGGLSPAPSPAATFNLQQGISGLVTNGQTANVTLTGTAVVSGKSVPFTGTGTFTLAPAVSATFSGAGALSQTETISGTVTAAGQTSPYSSSITDYYATGDDAFVGETGSNDYVVAQTAFTYPASVMAGSTGVLGTTSNYTDSTMGVPTGTTQVSYTVTAVAGSSTSVQVAVTGLIYDTQSTLIETDVTNYLLTASHALSVASASVQNASGSITVTAQ